MIPNIDILAHEITETQHPTNTYKIVFGKKDNVVSGNTDETPNSTLGEMRLGQGVLAVQMSARTFARTSVRVTTADRINGYVDGLDALAQAVYLILSTERYEFLIYSWDYGVELADLIGKPMPYVMAELPRRIKDALIQDNRINDVTNFEFVQHGKRLHVTFTVVSNVGNLSTELEVEV